MILNTTTLLLDLMTCVMIVAASDQVKFSADLYNGTITAEQSAGTSVALSEPVETEGGSGGYTYSLHGKQDLFMWLSCIDHTIIGMGKQGKIAIYIDFYKYDCTSNATNVY